MNRNWQDIIVNQNQTRTELKSCRCHDACAIPKLLKIKILGGFGPLI